MGCLRVSHWSSWPDAKPTLNQCIRYAWRVLGFNHECTCAAAIIELVANSHRAARLASFHEQSTRAHEIRMANFNRRIARQLSHMVSKSIISGLSRTVQAIDAFSVYFARRTSWGRHIPSVQLWLAGHTICHCRRSSSPNR